MSPAAAILIVDFWLIRKTVWNVPDLYKPGGIYWFNGGLNWKAFVAYFLGMFPALPGFVNGVSGMEVAITWRRFYQISFFFGYFMSAAIYLTLNKIFPPPGLGVQVDFDVDEEIDIAATEKIEGVEGDSLSKEPAATETKVDA